MKIKKIISLVSLGFALVMPARAGIPVLSPTELVQAVIEYQQMLKDYEEQLTMVQQGYDQYKQLITDYQQTLKEWDHLLEQCQSYKDLWGSYNWDSFLAEMSDYQLNSKSYSNDELMNLYNNKDYRESRTLYSAKNGKVYTYNDAINLLNQLKIKENSPLYDDMRIKENQVTESINKMVFVDKQNEQLSDNVDRIRNIQGDFDKLGDNSQLATMQYQAKLQSELLNLSIQQTAMLNQIIAQQNTEKDLHSAKMHQAQTNSLTKAQKALNKKIEIDQKGSGKINF